MKTKSVESRFFFHANAVALAGHIRRPKEFHIPAVASSCLPVTGGIGEAKQEKLNFGDVVSVASALTRVRGQFVDARDADLATAGKYGFATTTNAETQVSGLRIVNTPRVLEIDSLACSMGARTDRRGVTEFHALSTQYEGVRIDGAGLRITAHPEIFQVFSTKRKLEQAYAHDEEFRQRASVFLYSPKAVNTRHRRLPQVKGVIYGTVISKLEWEGAPPPDAVISGNSVRISGLGKLFFGEIVIEEHLRRLSLVRFQLGSSTGGSGTCGETQTNGTKWPPKAGGD